MFRERGAAIIDADEATHAVYAPGTRGFDEIVSQFGPQFIREGAIDRATLGELVFNDPLARQRLNAIVHPLVREWMAARTVEAVDNGADIVIQDVPLLFENDLQGLFSSTVLVYARPATQISRLVKGRGLTEDRARSMLRSQMPIDQKRALADFVIDNDETREKTRRQVADVWTKVRSL